MRLAALCAVFMLMSPFSAFAQECDYGIEILVDGDEFESQDFKWRMRAMKIEGKSTNITGTAEIESGGNTVKSYKPWTSDSIAKQKTSNEYSPNLKPGDYEIIAEISVECDDTNKDNNVDKKEITIKGEAEKTDETKSSNNKKTEPIKAEEQDAEKTSLQSTIPKRNAASEPKIQQSSTNPKSAEEFDNVIELKAQNNNKAKETQAITSNTIQNTQNGVVYESSNERARGWIMVFLLTLSILLNIVLIWKR